MKLANLMMKLLMNGFAVFATAYILPGVEVVNFLTAVIVAVFLGVTNTFLKPILIILTLPITILTLGLFTFIISALFVWLAPFLIDGFVVGSFWDAFLFSLVLSLVNAFLNSLVK